MDTQVWHSFFWGVDVTNGWFPSNNATSFESSSDGRVVTLNGETISRDGNLAVGEPQKDGPRRAEKFGGDISFLLFFFSWGGRVRKENRKQIETKVPSEISVLLGEVVLSFFHF